MHVGAGDWQGGRAFEPALIAAQCHSSRVRGCEPPAATGSIASALMLQADAAQAAPLRAVFVISEPPAPSSARALARCSSAQSPASADQAEVSLRAGAVSTSTPAGVEPCLLAPNASLSLRCRQLPWPWQWPTRPSPPLPVRHRDSNSGQGTTFCTTFCKSDIKSKYIILKYQYFNT